MEELVDDTVNKHNEYDLSIWRILAYFIIYSVLGWAVETTFAFVMYGVIESRQSFLYGPFCSIYGVGAVVMTVSLRYFDKNNYTLFIAGYIIGSIIEYLVSWTGEMLVGTRWWDYSDKFLNLNGRICFTYSIFWGMLSIYLIKALNPNIDKFINWILTKVSVKTFNIITVTIICLMFADCVYSALAEDWVLTKVSIENNLQVKGKERLQKKYDNIYNDKKKKAYVDKYWSIEHVLYSYPNLTKELEDGKRVYIKRLYPEIHPYLIRIKPEKERSIYEP